MNQDLIFAAKLQNSRRKNNCNDLGFGDGAISGRPEAQHTTTTKHRHSGLQGKDEHFSCITGHSHEGEKTT